MPEHRRKLLLDLTPLDTPSRPRGIGRYIRELVLGLGELPAKALEGLEIVGLTSLSLTGRYTLTSDPTSFLGSAHIPFPNERDFYRWAYRHRLAFWRAARAVGAGAVHLCDPHATPLFLGLAGCLKIVTCHDLIPSRFPDRYFGVRDGGAFVGKRIERRRYASADVVVAISDATRDDLTNLLQMPPQKVVRIYNGVDIERWAKPATLDVRETLARFGLSDRPFVLYAGGSDWRKNVEGMLGGIAAARARGTDFELAWVGGLQPEHLRHVDALARQAGVSRAVRQLGYINDEELKVLYRSATAHLLVSRCEGFGLTIVEAMASGCPVVTTRLGSLSEVAGDAAITVDPDDHAAIGAALIRIHTDRPLRADLILRGQRQAPRFSRAAQAMAMAMLYRRTLTPHRGEAP